VETASLMVLVVEDDPDLAALEAELLEEHGHRVEVARNGREALAVIERATPDLILLDMRMPVMNGREFADEYRRRQRSPAPIVVVTAAASAMSTPIRTPIGNVKMSMSGNVERKRMPMVDQDPGWRTTRSIRRTSCGTKNTNVNMPKPRKAWENSWRQMYRSIRRIVQRRHSSTLAMRGSEPRPFAVIFGAQPGGSNMEAAPR